MAAPAPPGALIAKAVLYNGVWRSPVGPKPRPLWVLREHDGAEECFKVMWSDRSHMMVDEDEVKDCDLVARAAAAQDVDNVDGPQNLEPLNQGLRLLEHASARVVKVKEERDDEREEKEDAQELTGHLVVSENAKMSEIDALKKEVAQKARRIAELEATSKEKDLRIVELEKSNRKKDQEIASLSSATSKGSTAANEPRSSKVKTKAPVKTKTVAKATAPAKTKTTGKAAETKKSAKGSKKESPSGIPKRRPKSKAQQKTDVKDCPFSELRWNGEKFDGEPECNQVHEIRNWKKAWSTLRPPSRDGWQNYGNGNGKLNIMGPQFMPKGGFRADEWFDESGDEDEKDANPELFIHGPWDFEISGSLKYQDVSQKLEQHERSTASKGACYITAAAEMHLHPSMTPAKFKAVYEIQYSGKKRGPTSNCKARVTEAYIEIGSSSECQLFMDMFAENL